MTVHNVWHGRFYEDFSQDVFANLGWDKVPPNPVFEGDTIHSRSTVYERGHGQRAETA